MCICSTVAMNTQTMRDTAAQQMLMMYAKPEYQRLIGHTQQSLNELTPEQRAMVQATTHQMLQLYSLLAKPEYHFLVEHPDVQCFFLYMANGYTQSPNLLEMCEIFQGKVAPILVQLNVPSVSR